MNKSNKKMNWKNLIIIIVSLAIIGGAVFFFLTLNSRVKQENEFYLTEDTLVIEGIYGNTYNLSEIEGVQLLDYTPELNTKLNGTGFGSISKGLYRVEDYGECNVYLYSDAKCIHIIVNGKNDILINFESESQTIFLYNQLAEVIDTV